MTSSYVINLSGKAAIVTGASSGIGAAVVTHMTTAGAAVLAVGRDAGRLGEVCSAAAGPACPLSLDLTEEDAPERVVATAREEFGRLDVLVHTAGIYLPETITGTTDAALDSQWRINVRAPYRLTRAAVPHLAPGSSVIFISSMLGVVGIESGSAYCATKGAVEQLRAALAVELAPAGVRVNSIAPGAIETPMNERMREDASYFAEQRDLAPAKRWGTVDDIAPAVVFLASDGADFCHGSRLAVDGGWVAR